MYFENWIDFYALIYILLNLALLYQGNLDQHSMELCIDNLMHTYLMLYEYRIDWKVKNVDTHYCRKCISFEVKNLSLDWKSGKSHGVLLPPFTNKTVWQLLSIRKPTCLVEVVASWRWIFTRRSPLPSRCSNWK